MATTFAQMRKFDDEGQAVDIDPQKHKSGAEDEPRWVIPIHVADKPGKPGQVRVCHDCRAPVEGQCLNDFILDGPALACDLVGVIMRFRDGGEVAVGGDIAAFFHNVYTHKKDSGAYRYRWYEDERMIRYVLKEFLGHVFGSKSSSCVATFTLRYHVKRNATRYGPEIVETVEKDFYVDDWLKSMRDVAGAKDMRMKLTAALKEGGFTLCNSSRRIRKCSKIRTILCCWKQRRTSSLRQRNRRTRFWECAMILFEMFSFFSLIQRK